VQKGARIGGGRQLERSPSHLDLPADEGGGAVRIQGETGKSNYSHSETFNLFSVNREKMSAICG